MLLPAAAAGLQQAQQRALTRLYNVTARLKAAVVAAYISDLLDAGDDKFLVFAHHRVRPGGVVALCWAARTPDS